MKFKRIIGLGLTLVMALTSVTVGFAEETADILELTETIDAEDSVMNDTSETVEFEQPIDTEETVETEETTETDSSENNEAEAETEEVTETELETAEAAESETELNNADELAEDVVLEEDKNVDLDTSSFTSGDYTYTVSDSSTVIISQYNGSSSSVTLPASVTYNGTTYKIRTVGSKAFEGNTSIKTLIIPDGITSIGNCAFKNCTSLSSITIKGDIVDCDWYSTSGHVCGNYSVFYNAGANAESLTVNFESGVTYVPAYLFAVSCSKSDGYYAHVTTVNFSDTVTEIGDSAFYCCFDLTTVNMSTGLATIDSYAFYNCTSLSKLGWGSNLTTIDSYAFANDTSLKTLVLPSKLKYINSHAFEDCSNVESIVFPSSTTSLGNCSFKNCTALSSITINGDITDCDWYSTNGHVYGNYSIFYNAGANTQSLTVTFGSGVTYVPSYLFATVSSKSDGNYARVTTVVIPSTVTKIGEYAFYKCYDLKAVEIPSSVKAIGENSFGDNSDVTFYVESGSYAITYANNNSIAYVIGSIPIVVSPPSFAVAGVFSAEEM
ncbi:MAG: leucine-rich repeat domain-containing protein [Clostridiales bacterium]|nr:leucine-rich repeat domain-containing protein [Clostridiales bacterium]